MSKKKTNPVRLNIYVHDPDIRRQIKTIAARKDVSISEYCFQAINNQLMEEHETDHKGKASSLKTAVKKAYRFHTKALRGRIFTVSSADLIRETRINRGT